MIDGLTFYIHTNIDAICDLLEFRNNTAKYKGLTIKIENKEVGYCSVKGSIHKYFNNGIDNTTDFTLSNYVKALDELCKDLDIKADSTRFTKVEVGANVDYKEVDYFLDCITLMNFKEIGVIKKNSEYTRILDTQHYTLKIYRKTINIIRVEVALKTTKHRKKVIAGVVPYCTTLQDLASTKVWRVFKDEVMRLFNSIVLFDHKKIDLNQLSDQELKEVTSKSNISFWTCSKVSRKTRIQRLNKYIDLLKRLNNGRDLKADFISLLDAKLTSLLDLNIEQNYKEKETFSSFEEFGNRCKKETISSFVEDNKNSEKETFSSVVKRVKRFTSESDKNKVCIVTNLSLDIGIKSNKTLTSKGVEYYYKNEREIYTKILHPYIENSKYKSDCLEVQFREIAHRIRGKIYNPRNNPKNNLKKSIGSRKIIGMELMFSFEETIRADKKEYLISTK